MHFMLKRLLTIALGLALGSAAHAKDDCRLTIGGSLETVGANLTQIGQLVDASNGELACRVKPVHRKNGSGDNDEDPNADTDKDEIVAVQCSTTTGTVTNLLFAALNDLQPVDSSKIHGGTIFRGRSEGQDNGCSRDPVQDFLRCAQGRLVLATCGGLGTQMCTQPYRNPCLNQPTP